MATRDTTTCLSVAVADTAHLHCCMDVNAGGLACQGKIAALLGVVVAEHRGLCPPRLDVLVGPGVAIYTPMTVLTTGVQTATVGLGVNVKSPTLGFGASALYNPDGKVVEAVAVVADGDEPQPAGIQAMTATLLYQGVHDLGTISFDCNQAGPDGTVTVSWLNPAHTDNLTVRFSGVVVNCGAVDIVVPVASETASTATVTSTLDATDNRPPRIHTTPYDSTTRQLDPAPEEVDVFDPATQMVLFELNAFPDDPARQITAGFGPVDYHGGGNRLLPNQDGTGFVLQAKDLWPVQLDAVVLSEPAGTNLLTNSDFQAPTSATDPVPSGYTVTTTPSVTYRAATQEEAGVMSVQLRTSGSGPYQGPTWLDFATPLVSVGPAPVTWSVLARVAHQADLASDLPFENVKIDTIEAKVTFYDIFGVEISSQTSQFDGADLVGQSYVLVHTTATPPGGTATASGSIRFSSIEESDQVTLGLLAPQVEASPAPTSRMVGPGVVTREADTIRVPQERNLAVARGSIILDLAPGYAGAPLADACLVDTRDQGANGFALWHQPDGKLRFEVAGPTTTATLLTDPVSLDPGEPFEAGITWDQDYRAVWLDDEKLVESTATFPLPSGPNRWIWVAQTHTGTDRFPGQFAALQVRHNTLTG